METLEQDTIKHIRQKLGRYFEDKEEFLAAYLYGSAACGKNKTESDVDIAILTTPYKDTMESLKARIRCETEISALLKKECDLVFLQEAGELLTFQILKNGIVIFERDREAHRSFRAYRLIQCLDFQFLEKRMQKGMVSSMRRSVSG